MNGVVLRLGVQDVTASRRKGAAEGGRVNSGMQFLRPADGQRGVQTLGPLAGGMACLMKDAARGLVCEPFRPSHLILRSFLSHGCAFPSCPRKPGELDSVAALRAADYHTTRRHVWRRTMSRIVRVDTPYSPASDAIDSPWA